MISSKILLVVAKKWHSSKSNRVADSYSKGHFVVCTADERRFTIPLEYLNNEIFVKLLEISKEEFGLPSDGPITLPCDAIFMEYLIMLVRKVPSTRTQKALLMSNIFYQF
ncbi:auxin-responsive protein SAUR67-like [Tripterygium wilfordii]|uniref:auxin-responsive protein SAUR67-like n=1 Tax=Tripterygium wilfordii TaxID=458696 RepID=UPI0018F85EBC|nr:auxin-responsive protein SAUR67-like [Tripterygium wilfordii]